jgi:hypothetical protein
MVVFPVDKSRLIHEPEFFFHHAAGRGETHFACDGIPNQQEIGNLWRSTIFLFKTTKLVAHPVGKNVRGSLRGGSWGQPSAAPLLGQIGQREEIQPAEHQKEEGEQHKKVHPEG